MSAENLLEKFAEHFNFKLETYVDSRLGHCVKLTVADDSVRWADIQFIPNCKPSYPLVYAYGHSKEDACKDYVENFLLNRDLDLFWLSRYSEWNKVEGFPRSSLEELAVFLDLNM